MSKYKPYPAYKDSVLEWLAQIPRNWEEKRLRHVVRPINEKLETTEFGLPYIGLENIERWTGKLVPTETEGQGLSNAFRPGDVLFGKLRPYLAKVHVAEQEGICTSEALVLRRERIESGFLKYWMLTPDFINAVDSSTYGAKMPRANWEFVGNLRVAVPPVKEQNCIATFLDRETARIDALIEKKQRLIELLKEKRQAVITQAVTKGLDPKVPMKDSGVEWLGEVPAHWGLVQLRHVVSFIGGGTPSKDNESFWEGDIPWVSPKDMKHDAIVTTEDSITRRAIVDTSTNLVNRGVVLIVVRGMILAHSVPTAIAGVDLALNQDMKALAPSRQVTSEYLLRLLQGLRDVLLSLIGSSAHGTKILPTYDLARLPVPLPGLAEQRPLVEALADALGKIDGLVERTDRSVDLLRKRRAALITAAVTGQIDVRDAA